MPSEKYGSVCLPKILLDEVKLVKEEFGTQNNKLSNAKILSIGFRNLQNQLAQAGITIRADYAKFKK